jgi:hypothetical protein
MMTRKAGLYMLWALVAVALVQMADAQASGCAGIGGSWTDITGGWILTEGTGGSITGHLSDNGHGVCPDGLIWNVSGSLVNGALTLTATYAGPTMPRPTIAERSISPAATMQLGHGRIVVERTGRLTWCKLASRHPERPPPL